MKVNRAAIPIRHIRHLYRYSEETGQVLHRKSGEEAGHKSKAGYRYVKVMWGGARIQIMTHIVVWALHAGCWPQVDIDHRDTARDHNRIENLREATRSQNLANRNKKGELPKGVTFDKGHKSKPYRAQLKIANKNEYLGHFVCPVEAGTAYQARAQEVFGEFTRV